MKKLVNTLIVDDSPMIVEAYKSMFKYGDLEAYSVNLDIAINCDEAISKMKLAMSKTKYDLFYFDVRLPKSSDGIYQSGLDLALFAKENFPESKVVILTMYKEVFKINEIIKKTNPHGLLIKNDSTPDEFINAFKAILDGEIFYSKIAMSAVSKTLTSKQREKLDENDLKILYHISQGVKTINLHQYVNLSLSSIEKKKANIKKIFNLTDGNDEDLIDFAKEKGII